VKGAVGAVSAIGGDSLFITVQGGQIEVGKLRYGSGKKLSAAQVAAEAGLTVGTVLGT
jgi:methionyl-tRNA formyltransferase